MKNTQVIMLLALMSSFFTSLSMAESPTLPAENERAGLSFKQAIKEYFKDCHATFSVMANKEGEEIRLNECVAYDTEQNCNIDYTGCNAQMETCKTNCEQPCDGCQESCANTCDDCKSQCQHGDKGCLTRCAIKRAKCRGGCLKSLTNCQGSACYANLEFCYYDSFDRLKKCDPNICKAWQECASKWPNERFKKCKALQPKDNICAQDCDIGISPVETFSDVPSVLETPQELLYNRLTKACTKKSSCPSDYRQILPFLDSFCAGALTNEQLNRLPSLVAKGVISKNSVNMVYNTYGAMYGYQFKKKLWMNEFFYGSGEWLPATCKSRIKSVVNAKYMPLAMTKLRDQVKKIWKRLK